MTLDNLMIMAKTDRYTQDRTYKPGEISEKTGLQKQNDGSWAPPKAGAAGNGNNADLSKKVIKNREKLRLEKDPKVRRQIIKENHELMTKMDNVLSSTVASPKINIGSDVKVRVANGRPGKVTEIRGDLVTVEMPAQGDKPARRDQYYKSDLIATPEKKSEGTQRIGINKQAAIAIAKKDGDSAFLMKNKDGEYAVVNSSADFDKAEKMGYEAANEELHPREQVSHVRSDSATPKGVMSEIGNGVFNAKHPEDFESEMASMGYKTLEFNDEYAVVSNNKGSQFQIKFTDHGDGRDFSAESMNLTYQDEDDDTDYDTEDSAPVRKLTADTKIRVRK